MDPDGRQTAPFSADFYGNLIKGELYAFGHTIKAGFQDFFGQIGNFFSNIFSGNAQASLKTEAVLNIQGLHLNGGVSYSTDSGISFSTNFTSTEGISSTIQELTGSPIKIVDGGGKISYGVFTGGFTEKDGIATISIEATAEKVSLDAIDVGIELSISASTQVGPYGTIENQKSESLNESVNIFDYYNSSDYMFDLLQE